MNHLRPMLTLALALSAPAAARGATLLEEDFDDVSLLAAAGWVMVNNSVPPGSTGWFQGQDPVFPAQAGAADSYVAANFHNAGAFGHISNWLLSPALTLDDGDELHFYTRQNDSAVPDSLEVRLSTNGASTDVGAFDFTVGDFTLLLLSVNPALASGGYPTAWTEFSVTLSGLAGPTLGRVGFRYVVPDVSTQGDYIGIDTLTLSSVPEPATTVGLGLGAGALAALRACRARRRP